MKKLVDFTESFFAIVALIGIVAISTVTVIALNPKEYQTEGGNIAGIESQNQLDSADKLPLLVESTSPDRVVYDEISQTYIYTSNVDLSNKLQYIEEFVKITNNNNTDIKVLLKAKILAPVVPTQSFSVKLLDYLDTILLVEKGKGPIERFVTIPSHSSRSFKLEYNSDVRINYPFTVEITID